MQQILFKNDDFRVSGRIQRIEESNMDLNESTDLSNVTNEYSTKSSVFSIEDTSINEDREGRKNSAEIILESILILF